MNKTILCRSLSSTGTISTIVLTILPEYIFGKFRFPKIVANIVTMLWESCPYTLEEISVTVGQGLFVLCILVCSFIINAIIFRFKPINLKKSGYHIRIEHGNLLEKKSQKKKSQKKKSQKKKKWLKVIPFDECFTTSVGDTPQNNSEESVCGRYLTKYQIKDEDVQVLIQKAGLIPCDTPSQYKNKPRYESGSLIRRDDFLLMAFAKLDKDGRGIFESKDEYQKSLSKLWEELDKQYAQCDVCIPVLGSGITRIGKENIPLQELVDMIICSYILSPYKIKTCLHIFCYTWEDFFQTKVYLMN